MVPLLTIGLSDNLRIFTGLSVQYINSITKIIHNKILQPLALNYALSRFMLKFRY